MMIGIRLDEERSSTQYSQCISAIIGMDGTEAFLEIHGDNKRVMRVLDSMLVGDLIDQQGLLENPEQVNHMLFVHCNSFWIRTTHPAIIISTAF